MLYPNVRKVFSQNSQALFLEHAPSPCEFPLPSLIIIMYINIIFYSLIEVFKKISEVKILKCRVCLGRSLRECGKERVSNQRGDKSPVEFDSVG